MKDNSYIFDSMDILSLHLYLRVAELKSLSKAAEDLSLSSASASARLTKLEETIGFRLFNRTTRVISLTTDGATFLPYAQQTIETLETGLGLTKGEKSAPKGLLRLAMPSSFGRMYIVPILQKFQARYPEITLDLRLSDEILNAVEGAYDLVIRTTHLEDSHLIARKLADDERILVSSPSYLKKHGILSKPSDLHQHKCIHLGQSQKIRFQSGEAFNTSASLSVNDGEAMRFLIESGMGIGAKSIWNVHKSLQTGDLVEVLPDHPLITDSALWVIYPSNRIVASKVRVMIDFLLENFQPKPPWG